MEVRNGKLGEHVMYATDFNRYEEFAAAVGNFAMLYGSAPAAAHQNEFGLHLDPTGGDERLAVVHSDHVYGKHRQIERWLLDVAVGDNNAHADFDFDPPIGDCWIYIEARPILVDFDPETLTWDQAYVDYVGSGKGLFDSATPGDEENLGSEVTSRWHVNPREAPIDFDLYFPTWLMAKTTDLSTWNGYDHIHGWEFRFNWDPYYDAPKELTLDATLTGGPAPLGFRTNRCRFVAADQTSISCRISDYAL